MRNSFYPVDADVQTVAKSIQALVRRAEGGDVTVLPELRDLLDASPEIWRHASDAATHVELSWIEIMAGDNLMVRESLIRRVQAMRDEITETAGDPLEILLVDRIVVSWLQVAFLQARSAQHHADSTKPETAAWKKRLDAAHRRHLEGIRIFAEVRKLLPRG